MCCSRISRGRVPATAAVSAATYGYTFSTRHYRDIIEFARKNIKFSFWISFSAENGKVRGMVKSIFWQAHIKSVLYLCSML